MNILFNTVLFFVFSEKSNGEIFQKVSPAHETKINDLPSKSGERKDKRKSPPIHDTNIDDLPSDPGERKDIIHYPVNKRDEV